MSTGKQIFRLRTNLFLAGTFALIILFFMILIFFTSDPGSNIRWTMGGVAPVMLLAIIAPRFGSWYVVDLRKGLIAHKSFGLIGRVIEIRNIVSIEQGYNWAYAPAFSLKSLNIREKYGAYPLMSPIREKEFLKLLKKLNPGISIRSTDKKAWHRLCDWDI